MRVSLPGEEGPSLVSGMDGAHLCIPLTKTKQLFVFPFSFSLIKLVLIALPSPPPSNQMTLAGTHRKVIIG